MSYADYDYRGSVFERQDADEFAELLASASGDHSEPGALERVEERWDYAGRPPPNREAYPPDGELVFEIEIDPPCAPTLRDPGLSPVTSDGRASAAGDRTMPADAGGGKP